MKNSNSLTNYSILVLVLLVLILIYIHIPNPQIVMRGGASADIQNMINKDGIYSNTLGHPIMQWVILVVFIILIYLAYMTSLGVFAWTGAPVLGINGLVDTYSISGPGFLKKFYQLTQDSLVLKNGIGGKDPMYPDDMELYKNGIVDFKTSMASQIKIFCNEAVKCNPCECPGAMKDNRISENCKPNVSDRTGGLQATAMRNANAESAEKFMGFIPKCCCLTKLREGNYSYVKDKNDAQDFSNKDLWKIDKVTSVSKQEYNTYTWKGGVGLLTNGVPDNNAKLHGCEVSKGGELKDKSGKVSPIETDVKKLSEGNPDPLKKDTCVCPDGDPTLNYYNYNKDSSVLGSDKKIVITDVQKLKLKANLFATWAKNEKDGDIGKTEISYRVKSTDDIAKLYNFPDSYYTDPITKTTFKSECLVDGYILAGKKESPTSDKIVCDKSTWSNKSGDVSDISSNSRAGYMVGKNKYFYHLPNSSYIKPSLFEPPDDFKKAVEEQMKAIEEEKNKPKDDGFFGGIYNYIFPVKK
jgi:hypothetical protein